MLSINDITTWANERVCQFIPGLKSYGVAKTASNGDKIMPYVDEKYIGIDDTYHAMLYHKKLTIGSTTVPRSGYGDNEASLQNTYGMAMILYYNEKKCGFTADKLYTFIQSSITGVLKSEGYRSIRVNVLNAVLNDAQVWAQEYGASPFKLAGPQRLIQVNYSIVMVLDKNCIEIPKCLN
jgi:hypothetical protein